ncbi:AaceriACR184Cp [[Ashbya] aceris (nom. inval.)]|nr:AaceriACR184Cp [[Ashbya] aceris (nom. inval.)]
MALEKAVVLHFGKHSTVAGFSNRDLPQCVLPSAYLMPDDGEPVYGLYELMQAKEYDIYTLFDNRGVPTDWDMLERFCRWIYATQLRVGPEELPVCITVPPDLSATVRSQFHELMLCKLRVPVLQLISEPLAVTLSLGRSTALVVDVGASKVTVTPIVDGSVVKTGILRSRYAGDFLDFQLMKALDDRPDGTSLYHWQQSRTWMRDFKNTMLQVSLMRLSEVEKQLQKQSISFIPIPLEGRKHFLFKRQKTITWDLKQCYRIPESLFDPSTVSPEFESSDGLSDLVGKAIKKCAASITSSNGSASQPAAIGVPSATPEQIHAALLTNVVIIGGTSLLQGLEQRLVNDLSLQFPQYKLSTYATPAHVDRQLQSWQGGVNMCHLPDWKLGSWVTKQEYLESLDK